MADTKKLFADQLRKLSVKELVEKRKELRKQLHQLKMQNQMGALKQTHLLKLTRRNIARVNTVLTEKIKENYPGQTKKK
jgi:large subunit ribosomal protein L29